MVKNPYDAGKKGENSRWFPSLAIRVCLLEVNPKLGLMLAVANVFLLSYLGYGQFSLDT